MSAEILRRAATEIRDEWGDRGTAWHRVVSFHLAVADWLDDEASEIPPGASETKWGPIENAPAVKVARAYIGETT